MLRILMDGAGDMPAEWAREYDIHVIPINIHFKDEVYLQGINLTNDDFYQMADNSPEVPKTSQPTPQQFIETYQRIAQPGDTILSVHVTSKLSGTYSSAVMAARELADKFNIIPIDSGTGSVGMGFMCREARLMERLGASLQAIKDRLAFIGQNTSIVLTLDTLEYARKSGRVKTLQAALASLLNVKPIAVLREGVLYMAERVRTRQKALDAIVQMTVDRFGDIPLNIAVVHARDPRSGELVREKVLQRLQATEMVLADLSIGVAANLGPGTVGIVAYPSA